MNEDKYWETLKVLNLFSDVTPTNAKEEKDKFFESLTAGKVYNPQFIYTQRDTNDLALLKECKSHLPEDPIIADQYIEHYNETLIWISCFMDRDSPEFSKKLTALHPTPDNEELAFAKDVLDKALKAKQEMYNAKYTDEEAVELFRQDLKQRGYTNWTVMLKDISAKAMVSSLRLELQVKNGSSFSQTEIDRLIVHEIGTHIKRYENGTKQAFKIYRYGFPNYLETEEGLAIYNEYKHGLLLSKDLIKYALRVIACSRAASSDFFGVFQHLCQFTTREEAWNITLRVKRGLNDTSQPGGFLKDQLYLKGFRKVKNLSEEQIEKLWIGKIA